MTLIEADINTGNISFVLQNDDGFITHRRFAAPSTNPLAEAESVAESFEFDIDGGWMEGSGGIYLAYLIPKPLAISFVASEITSEDAFAVARHAGYEVVSVISKKEIPDEGKVTVVFDVEKPLDFSFDDFEPVEPFYD